MIHIENISDEAIESLRFAIVKQAILDYESALKWLRKHPQGVGYTYSCTKNTKLRTKNECEIFFRSQWYACLCDIDGEALMKTIRKRFYNRPIRWRDTGKRYKKRREKNDM